MTFMTGFIVVLIVGVGISLITIKDVMAERNSK